MLGNRYLKLLEFCSCSVDFPAFKTIPEDNISKKRRKLVFFTSQLIPEELNFSS